MCNRMSASQVSVKTIVEEEQVLGDTSGNNNLMFCNVFQCLQPPYTLKMCKNILLQE